MRCWNAYVRLLPARMLCGKREWMTGKIETLLLNYNSESLTVRPCAYSDEEMYLAVKERLQNLENGTAGTMDGDECLSQIRTRYGIEA